jgi:hypothetical protein
MIEFSPEWFDSCSRAWLANKKRDGHSYIYKCGVETCRNRVKGVSSYSGNCSAHAGAGICLGAESIATAERGGTATRGRTMVTRSMQKGHRQTRR